MHDSAAASLSFGNEEAQERHTKDLEKEAAKALKRGDISSAKHFLKRDVVYTMGTQGYDDEDTLRLLGEIKKLEQLEKQKAKETSEKEKSAKPTKSVIATMKLADLMLSGS